jgi:hypothetical protein
MVLCERIRSNLWELLASVPHRSSHLSLPEKLYDGAAYAAWHIPTHSRPVTFLGFFLSLRSSCSLEFHKLQLTSLSWSC